MTAAMAKPPNTSASGLEIAMPADMRLAERSTSRIDSFIRAAIVFSRLKLLTILMPCTVSCSVCRMRVEESNERRANLRTRLISLPSSQPATGITDSAIADSIGSCTIITETRPISVSASRPTLVTSSCSVSRTRFADMAMRVMNSLECRSWKKRMSMRRMWSNSRDCTAATILLPVRDSSTE
jgi:hypothetical protein